MARFSAISLIFFLLLPFENNFVSATTSTLYDFNTPGDLLGFFNGTGATSSVTQAATGGLSDSGSVSLSGSANAIFSTKAGYSIGPVGSTYTFQSYIKSEFNSGYSGVGFTTESSSITTVSSPVYRPSDALGISVHGGGFVFHNGATNYSGNWGSDYTSGSLRSVKKSSCSDLINNTTECGSPDKWFKIIFKVERLIDNKFDMRVEVWPSNQDGTLRFEEATAIFEVREIANTVISTAPQIYSYFNFSGHRVTRFDDYAINLGGGATVIEAGFPVVLTNSATLAGGKVTLEGNVSADGGSSVTERGFVYATSTSPTTSNSKISVGSGTGLFNTETSSLEAGTYYFRAFATNSTGTSYGSESIITVTSQKEIRISNISTDIGVDVPLNIALRNFSDAEKLENYQATVRFVDNSGNPITNGVLSTSTTSGLTLISGYNSFSGSRLGFRGGFSNIENALAAVTWTPNSSSQDLKIQVDLASAPGTNQFYDPDSGRYYEYVSTARSWDAAKCFSKFSDASYSGSTCSGTVRRTLFGLNGYLAHITSKSENDFIANFTSASNIWIGATDAASEGQWRWAGEEIAGESDFVFGTYETTPAGTKSSTPVLTAPGWGLNEWYPNSGRVAGWAIGEPNDWSGNEDCAVTNWSGSKGQWNDLTCSGTYGYLIEYGGAGGTSTSLSMFGTANLTSLAAAPTAPTITGLSSGNGQLFVTFTAPSSNGGSTITNYEYSLDGITFTPFSPARVTSPLTIPDLVNGSSYSVSIRAINSVGPSSASGQLSGTPMTTPSAPTISSITAGNNQLSVNFVAAATGGSDITNYLYSTDGINYIPLNPASTTSPFIISTLSADGTTPLVNGTSYPITIKAVNSVGESIASSSVTATPVAPPAPQAPASAPTAEPTPTPTPTPT
jgi:hypothetical protein